MNSEESSKMLSITPPPPLPPNWLLYVSGVARFPHSTLCSHHSLTCRKRYQQKPTENREAMCIICCHFVGEESELERQHKGPVGTLSFVASLGQVPCSLCELNPTSDWSDLRNCITALCGTISTNSTAAGGF